MGGNVSYELKISRKMISDPNTINNQMQTNVPLNGSGSERMLSNSIKC